MNKEEIIDFKNSIVNLSLDELETKRTELQDKIAKMIMDSDIVMQIALVEAQIEQRRA